MLLFLTMGAIGSIVRALLASKIKASMKMLLFFIGSDWTWSDDNGVHPPSYLAFFRKFLICETSL